MRRPHLVTALFEATYGCGDARVVPLGGLTTPDFQLLRDGHELGVAFAEDMAVVFPVERSVNLYVLLLLDWSVSVSDDAARRALVQTAVGAVVEALARREDAAPAPVISVATFAGDASRISVELPWTSDTAAIAAFVGRVASLALPAHAGTAFYAAVTHAAALVDVAVRRARHATGLVQGSIFVFTDGADSVNVVTAADAEQSLRDSGSTSLHIVRVGVAGAQETSALGTLVGAAPHGSLRTAPDLAGLAAPLASAAYAERARNRGVYGIQLCTAAQGDVGVATFAGATAEAPHVLAVTLAGGAAGATQPLPPTLAVPFSAAGFTGARCASPDAPGTALYNATRHSVCETLACGAFGPPNSGYECPCGVGGPWVDALLDGATRGKGRASGIANDTTTVLLIAIPIIMVVGSTTVALVYVWMLRRRHKWVRVASADSDDEEAAAGDAGSAPTAEGRAQAGARKGAHGRRRTVAAVDGTAVDETPDSV